MPAGLPRVIQPKAWDCVLGRLRCAFNYTCWGISPSVGHRPAASAPPRKSLGMQILGPTPVLLTQEPWEVAHESVFE